jgi:hypothetical protein
VINEEMVMPIPNRPSIVKQAEDADAAYVNAEHEAGQRSQRESLEHYRKCGDRLLKKKAALKHGEWGKWLKANVKFNQQTATRYMRFAEQAKLTTVVNLEELWASTRHTPATNDDEPVPAPDRPKVPTPTPPKAEPPKLHRPPAEVSDPAHTPSKPEEGEEVDEDADPDQEDATDDETLTNDFPGPMPPPVKVPPLIGHFCVELAGKIYRILTPKDPLWEQVNALIKHRDHADDDELDNVVGALNKLIETCSAVIRSLRGEGVGNTPLLEMKDAADSDSQ